MVQKKNKPEELAVFISSREAQCDECNENLGKGAWITLKGEGGGAKGGMLELYLPK